MPFQSTVFPSRSAFTVVMQARISARVAALRPIVMADV